MEQLFYIYIGFLIVAFFICLLALIIHRRRRKKAARMTQEAQQVKNGLDQISAPQQATQAPTQAGKSKKPTPAPAPPRSLDQVIQSAFGSLEEGSYRQASQLFQQGLQMTDNPEISLQLNLELAKIHHNLSEQETALKHINAALDLSRQNKNGATEQEILNIKTLISAQNST